MATKNKTAEIIARHGNDFVNLRISPWNMRLIYHDNSIKNFGAQTQDSSSPYQKQFREAYFGKDKKEFLRLLRLAVFDLTKKRWTIKNIKFLKY